LRGTFNHGYRERKTLEDDGALDSRAEGKKAVQGTSLILYQQRGEKNIYYKEWSGVGVMRRNFGVPCCTPRKDPVRGRKGTTP